MSVAPRDEARPIVVRNGDGTETVGRYDNIHGEGKWRLVFRPEQPWHDGTRIALIVEQFEEG